MSWSIDALFWRTMKSRGRFRIYCRKGTSGQFHHPVGARSHWYRRRIGPGDSVLTIERWIRSLYIMGIQSHILMTFLTNPMGPNISTRLTWSLDIIRYQLNPLMCGRLSSNPRSAFVNGCSCLLGWWMPSQPSWGWWKKYFYPSQTHL